MTLPANTEELLNTYHLKEDLIKLCRSLNLPSSGSKKDLLERLSCTIEGRPIPKTRTVSGKKRKAFLELSREALIDSEYANDEAHRAFFAREIGAAFKFNVLFMNWMKAHRGTKKYSDAIDEWCRLDLQKKNGYKTPIGSQFEYNRYTRDFFAANPGKGREECVRCWHYKKGIPGNHAYETDDLRILEAIRG